MFAQVAVHIGAEGAQVGHPARVHRRQPACGQVGVPGVQLLLGAVHVVVQQHKRLHVGAFLFAQKTHAVLVQVQRPFDTAATGLTHAAPVLERVADEFFGRDGGDGLVPVLHLHRVQRNVDHVAIGVLLRHLDPVAHPHHVVRADLHTRHQRQQRVLEHQQQHRHHRAQARQQDQRRAVHQRGQDQHCRHCVDDDFQQLQIPLDRLAVGVGAALVHLVGQVQRLANGQRQRQDDERAADVAHHQHHLFRQVRHHPHTQPQHQRRYDIGQPGNHLELRVGLAHHVAGLYGVAQAAQQHPFGQPVGHPGQQQQGPDHGDVVGPWIRLQGFLQRIQCFVHDVKSPCRWARCRAGNGGFSQAPYHHRL